MHDATPTPATPPEPELNVTGPGGWGLHVSGTLAAMITMMAAVAAGVGWKNHLEHNELLARHEIIIRLETSQLKETRIQNWLLSMPFDQRPRLPRPPEAEELLKDGLPMMLLPAPGKAVP